ncbi:MAG: TAXI family TRAP transporter solute-binding subunit [Candidatus Tectomicrobia bacterium]|nr:TAXI family TRAP transporter solute-binding subunit [Candidatus Tectomicrobia bacterium]
MKRRRVRIVGLFLLPVFLGFLGPGPVAAQRVEIQLMTASPGGVWFTLGTSMTEILQSALPNLSMSVGPGGAITNQMAIEMGRSKMGFVHSVSSIMGWRGEEPFKRPTPKVRWFASIGGAHLHFITLRSANLRFISELKGKRLATLVKGNFGELAARMALEAHGLSYKDMSKVSYGSFQDGINQLRDGHADVFVGMMSVPTGSVMELAATRPVRLLSFAPGKVQALAAKNPGFAPSTVPVGAYQGMDLPAETVTNYYGVLVAADLPESLVYDMAKALMDKADRFISAVAANKWMTAKDLAKNTTSGVIPYHPGAEKLYRERGLLN